MAGKKKSLTEWQKKVLIKSLKKHGKTVNIEGEYNKYGTPRTGGDEIPERLDIPEPEKNVEISGDVLPEREPKEGSTLLGPILDTIMSLPPLGPIYRAGKMYEESKKSKSSRTKKKVSSRKTFSGKRTKKKVSARKTYSGKKRVF